LQTDVQTSAQRVTVGSRAEIDFGVDDWISREPHLHLRSNNLYRTQEATRPTHCKQLLRIGAVTGGARNGKLYVQPAIRGTGRASLPATARMGFGGVEHFHGLSRGVLFGHSGCVH